MSEKEARKAQEQAQPEAELNDEELEQAAGGLSIYQPDPPTTGPVNSFAKGCNPIKSVDCPTLTVYDAEG